MPARNSTSTDRNNKNGKTERTVGVGKGKEAESKFVHHNRILFVVNGKQLERDVWLARAADNRCRAPRYQVV